MPDHVDSESRSRIMALVGSKNTKPELALRSFLHSKGYRFRLHRKDLPGTPDMVLPKYQLAIFVHGCYWHRHTGCAYATMPKSRVEFWKEKFVKNARRDSLQQEQLILDNWRVLVVWQCGMRHCKDSMNDLIEIIESEKVRNEWPIRPPKMRNFFNES
ncbi:DNA mismatch endonuclease Vsr [Halomonas campisalis]|uniref:Very short patch repair endonuclease n=1 Tax=Billgrantia campisalis TaxID=74661 RepID=A0ABS9P9K4_9GAMM|nr:very short patch repair endonuclease [Halomonas campisalis]MCG6658443.1 DNA mismatch endonuclease Vsr [Halomonas campisalis]MDR5863114.1 very short patch repair endonuclease [Halomonas campisalis]